MKIDLAFETIIIEDQTKIAFCRQELFQVFLMLWSKKEYNNQKLIGISKYQHLESRFYHVCKNLVSRKILFGFNKTTKGYSFFIKNTEKAFTLEQVTCAIYPYGYLSFLSAMNIYKLSEVKSSAIYYVTYNRPKWKNVATKDFINQFKKIGITFRDSAERFEYLKEDNADIYDELVYGKQIRFSDEDFSSSYSYQSTIPSYPVEDPFNELFKRSDFSKSIIIHTKKELDEYEWWANVRLQNINDLLIDMLRYPQYCGGLTHVVEVYKNHLNKYLDTVIKKVNLTGTTIDKARLGFILERCLNYSSNTLSHWKIEQQGKRGGSRKLVANLDFDSIFDPEWNISINHDEFKKFI